MLKENDRFRDFLGVSLWHSLGYTGENGLTITGENIHDENDKNYNHAHNTAFVFHEIAPDRKLIYVGGDNNRYTYEEDIKETEADSMFMSYTSYSDGFDDWLRFEYFTPICSIGNDNNKKYNKMAKNDNLVSVGAYYLRDNKAIPAYFSSASEYIDFSAPTMLKTDISSKFGGTSCSAPILCGMIALINDFFIQKTGKPLKRKKMIEFLKDNSIDIGKKGFDDKTGFGMVILPDPRKIDIKKYGENKKMFNSRNIDDLREDVAVNCKKLLELCKEKGLNVLVTNTIRDDEYQQYCYERKTGGKPPATFHSVEAGLAFDICKNVKGHEYDDEAFFDSVAEIAQEIGFSWGYDMWGYDKPHFQWDEYCKYKDKDIIKGNYPPKMPEYMEVENMTKEQVNELIDKKAKEISEKQVSEWAKKSWDLAIKQDIFDGSRPQSPITRQEMAIVLDRLGLI